MISRFFKNPYQNMRVAVIVHLVDGTKLARGG